MTPLLLERDTPQLLLDLDQLDQNLDTMRRGADRYGVDLRVHFKSLKCGGLAQYLQQKGVTRFLCSKLCEAEVLVDAGIKDVYLANQVVGASKMKRIAALASRAQLAVCADSPQHVKDLGQALMEAQGSDLAGKPGSLNLFLEVNIGMERCGVDTAAQAQEVVREIGQWPGLRFAGIQAYDGHLQGQEDTPDRAKLCRDGLAKAMAIRGALEEAGFAVGVVTGGGTSTWETVASYPGVTEIQPGSFLLMDGSYHRLRPEFGISQSILATVISAHPGRYILDAGTKAVSQDFVRSSIKNRPKDRVLKVNEEHTIVQTDDAAITVGDRVEIYSGHCCATMNLHRSLLAIRKGKVEAQWAIEASGRYD